MFFFQAKIKSERNRVKVQEFFQKQAHSLRAEAAQARKEEKRRAEKDKIMAEEDPDKQRRMEVTSQLFYSQVMTYIFFFFSYF